DIKHDASKTAHWVIDHKEIIATTAIGIAVGAACTGLSLGLGAFGCAVLAGGIAGGMGGAFTNCGGNRTASRCVTGIAVGTGIGAATGALFYGAGKLVGTIGKTAWGRIATTKAGQSIAGRIAARRAATTVAEGVEGGSIGGIPRPTGGRGPAGLGGIDPSGVPARSLDHSQATINSRGTNLVETHLRRFTSGGPLDGPEQGMLDRLRRISGGALDPTDYDRAFYTHELRELVRYRRAGFPGGQPRVGDYELWDALHTASLRDYGITRAGAPTTLYHPSVR
ncbi:MAG: hypothetical protein WBF71_14860, partial [Microthrixaceae bacterium]